MVTLQLTCFDDWFHFSVWSFNENLTPSSLPIVEFKMAASKNNFLAMIAKILNKDTFLSKSIPSGL